MVLQDVNESAPESFSDNPSPDQNDTYASPSSGPRFDPTDFPQPLPYGIAIFSTKDQVRRTAEETLKFAERRLGRKLESPESQALAYHIYQLEQTKSYFALTGSGLGLWRAYSTMATNRYPFYQPPPGSINPNKFAFVNGSLAPILRHSWRFSLYYVFGLQMGLVLGQMIAQPLAAQRTALDPKLEQFANDLKSSAATVKSAAMEQREARENRREVERQVKDRNGMGPAPQASWGRQPAPAKGRDDDMSPTAGNEAWGSQPSNSGSWDAFSSQGAQDQSSQSQAWNRQGASSNSSDYDDASPTGGLFQDEVRTSNEASAQPEQTQAPLRPGESAWDRLRRGGTPIPTQRPPPQQSRPRAEPERREQRDGSTLGDSFTFVEGEEERKKERERAQAEFDARIERERQGKDFNSDEGKRW